MTDTKRKNNYRLIRHLLSFAKWFLGLVLLILEILEKLRTFLS